jgi:hypothetical protein
MAKSYSCVVIYAEHGEDFQEYVDEAGNRIPAGEPIGSEISFNGGEPILYLFDGVYFSSEAF